MVAPGGVVVAQGGDNMWLVEPIHILADCGDVVGHLKM